MWKDVLHLFQEYMGTGLIVIWFLASLVYLWMREKRKHIRIVFLYVPVILLLLFFNPLFARLVYRMADEEIYYRILWLLPMTVVIAFGVVKVYEQLEGRKRNGFLAAAVLLLLFSGSLIYRNPYFHKAENLYHVPQSVVDLCDAIEVEGREVKAVFPAELLQYVRQYSPVVCMPYGRDIVVSRWTVQNALYDLMEAEKIDAAELAEQARMQECVYIILREDKKLNGKLEDSAYEHFADIDGYVVYKDSTVDLYYFLK